MLPNDKKLELLEKVANSKAFQKSPSSTALLRYLVKESIKGTNLKEGVIEAEFYGSKEGSNNSNPRVRVNVYNLRKKLITYYENEGKEEFVRLIIDKGQYNVRFETKEQEVQPLKEITIPKAAVVKPNRKLLVAYLIIFILSMILIIQNLPQHKPLIWKNFLENELNTTLYMGDAFGMIGKSHNGKPIWIKDFNINNIQDYYEYKEKYPELKDSLSPANYSYMSSDGAIAARNLALLYANYDLNFDIRFSSKVQYNDIKDENFIFVGSPLKKKFTGLFNEVNPYCEYSNNKFQLQGHPELNDTLMDLHTHYDDPYEYAVVSRTQGPLHTEQFFFFSKHEIGNMATFEYFTNTDSLTVFTKKHLQNNSNFTAIYRVFGKERVDMGFEEVMVVPF